MKKEGQTQDPVRSYSLHSLQSMFPYIVAMVRILLRSSHCFVEFPEKYPGQPQLPGFSEILGIGGDKELDQFCLDPFRTDLFQCFSKIPGCILGLFLNVKSQMSRKPHGS